MFKNFLAASAAVAVMALSAHAGAATIDFEGIPDGAAPGDFYLETFGVRFSGGVVHYNKDGAYVQGRTTMTFAAGSLGNRLNFMADGWFLDSMTWTYIGTNRYEPWMIESMSYQPPGYGTTSPTVPGYYQGKTWPGRIFLDERVTGIAWETWALSSLEFDAIAAPAAGSAAGNVATGEVPLPGTAWLLGAGMLALLGRRRK